MSDELNLIKIIGAISKELENECQDKVYAKEVGDEWHRQLVISGDVVAERNGGIQKLRHEVGAKNTTINRQNAEIDKLKARVDWVSAQRDGHEQHLININKICDEVQTVSGLGDVNTFFKVEVLADTLKKSRELRDWHMKDCQDEKAKASKVNAEKLAYMRIVKEVLTDCTEIVEIEDKYKSYLAGVKK